MEKMKSNIIRGKKEMNKVVSEVNFKSLPDSIIRQLAVVGITNTKQYNNSSYRLSTERLFKYYIEKFIIYLCILAMFIGLIGGMVGDIRDVSGSTQILFIFAYVFAIVTLITVYEYYYMEMVEPWALKVEKLSDYELQLMRAELDEKQTSSK